MPRIVYTPSMILRGWGGGAQHHMMLRYVYSDRDASLIGTLHFCIAETH